MNKDLEIIKNNLGYITGENCEVDKEYDDIIAAAERMAAEIEQLKEEVNETQTVYYSVLKDNTRLKAELEKRPAVVRCGECEKSYFQNYTDGTAATLDCNGFPVEEDWFCADGQRKSEEA